MDAQLATRWILNAESVMDDLAQHAPGRAYLAGFLEEVVVGRHVEGEPLAELVERNASPALPLLTVLDDLGHEHADFLNSADSVIPGVIGVHGNRIPARRVLSAPLDEVR